MEVSVTSSNVSSMTCWTSQSTISSFGNVDDHLTDLVRDLLPKQAFLGHHFVHLHSLLLEAPLRDQPHFSDLLHGALGDVLHKEIVHLFHSALVTALVYVRRGHLHDLHHFLRDRPPNFNVLVHCLLHDALSTHLDALFRDWFFNTRNGLIDKLLESAL